MPFAGLHVVESLGSIWWIDEVLERYWRMPKVEMPRECPEWSDSRAGACQDAVWHPLLDWWIDEADGGRLIIRTPDVSFWAPMTEATFESTFDLFDAIADRLSPMTNEDGSV